MILKKNLGNSSILRIIRNIIYKFIYSMGVISLLFIILLVGYYYNSGMHERFKPIPLIKKIDKIILDKYLGFSIFEISNYAKIKFISLKYIFINNNFENVTIKIDQKNIYNLELQRKNKKENISVDFKNFSKAKLEKNKINYDIKIRVKGDRVLHWYDKDQTSYKIDLRGEERVWGLEEFSVQKPITRNYIHELIFHKLLEFSNLISLKYFFINLSLNDTDQGIYAVEEGFSKELIERNKKRNGPIFGLEESSGSVYPNVEYDLYSKDYWTSNHPKLIEVALSKLASLKSRKTNINEIFDIEKWATYFAIIDLSHTLHGSLSKSVKLYYNPVTAKFEPIGFDGHHNSNLFNDFLILDFMDKENLNCSYICADREWYLRFFKNNDGSNNSKFIELYTQALKNVSKEIFLKNFDNKYFEQIKKINSNLISEVSKKDLNYYKGLGLYIFDKDFLLKRADYINNRINRYIKKNTSKTIFKYKKDMPLNLIENKNIQYLNGEYYLTKNLIIEKNYYFSENQKLNVNEGVEIFFKEDATLFSEGEISFNGSKEKPIVIYSNNKSGSFVLSSNNYNFKNVIFQNLSFPKSISKILYGGINIINSNLKMLNVEIKNSNSEDAINIISSKSDIKNLIIINSAADAIDVDFGELVFENITCRNILNDCLDVSGADVNGKQFGAINIKDKGVSFGENSTGFITDAIFINNKLAVAVKDGSNLSLSKYKLSKNEYDIAVFNKKKEYKESTLNIDIISDKVELNILLGDNNKIISNSKIKITKFKNSYINNLFY